MSMKWAVCVSGRNPQDLEMDEQAVGVPVLGEQCLRGGLVIVV